MPGPTTLRLAVVDDHPLFVRGLELLLPRTVKRMTAALLRRLRVSSRIEAAALAGHAGLLTE